MLGSVSYDVHHLFSWAADLVLSPARRIKGEQAGIDLDWRILRYTHIVRLSTIRIECCRGVLLEISLVSSSNDNKFSNAVFM